MNASVKPFKSRAVDALSNKTLKIAVERTAGTAESKRATALGDFDEYEQTRTRGRQIKDHVLDNLSYYLKTFEKNATAAGATVHWARDADEACRIVIEICKEAGAQRVTRASKPILPNTLFS